MSDATTLPRHPAYMFRSVLLDGWDATNTAGLDPNIEPRASGGLALTRDWYTTVDYDPLVALTNFSEGVASASGYTSQTAGRPAALREGSGMATVFAEGDHGYGDGDLPAEEITDLVRKEIERVAAKTLADRALPGPWEDLATTWDQSAVDRDPTPPVWQEQISVSYFWNKTA